jgi:hypothetical protein
MKRLLVLLAACGGGSRAAEPTIRFSLLQDYQLDRIALAAIGAETRDSTLVIATLQDLVRDGLTCPAIHTDDDGVTLEGPCSGYWAGGYYEVSGLVRATHGAKFDFDNFRVGGFIPADVSAGAYSGSFENRYNELSADFGSDREAAVIQTALSIGCELDDCTIEGALDYRDIDGVDGVDSSGGMIVTGSVHTHDGIRTDGDGSITLQGEQTLDVTITGGCVTWQIRFDTRRSFDCVSRL